MHLGFRVPTNPIIAQERDVNAHIHNQLLHRMGFDSVFETAQPMLLRKNAATIKRKCSESLKMNGFPAQMSGMDGCVSLYSRSDAAGPRSRSSNEPPSTAGKRKDDQREYGKEAFLISPQTLDNNTCCASNQETAVFAAAVLLSSISPPCGSHDMLVKLVVDISGNKIRHLGSRGWYRGDYIDAETLSTGRVVSSDPSPTALYTFTLLRLLGSFVVLSALRTQLLSHSASQPPPACFQASEGDANVRPSQPLASDGIRELSRSGCAQMDSHSEVATAHTFHPPWRKHPHDRASCAGQCQDLGADLNGLHRWSSSISTFGTAPNIPDIEIVASINAKVGSG
ncbi:hypothetical protein BKA70DRAFT_1404147 [Coprinopsis sp. MPI-PUGE-AT-0042]|nr:hypothetical protein BKA70DRAFT_1404147 [Coprinopsis sp. MPI-PUGE-AT-0042]